MFVDVVVVFEVVVLYLYVILVLVELKGIVLLYDILGRNVEGGVNLDVIVLS